MKRLKAYRYRLYPTLEQEVLLAKHFGSCRWVYNYALSKKIEYYTLNKQTLSRFDIQKDLVTLKAQEDTSWLSEVNSQSLQASLVNLDMAYTRFFREKKGFPKFKSKRDIQSVQFPQKTKVDFGNNRLYVMKFREGIKCIFHRSFEGNIKTTTINKTCTNKYFVSILVEEEVFDVKKQLPVYEKAIGIDLGLKSFLVTSRNEVFENPKFFKKTLRKLKRAQRRLSRRKKGGNNYKKQKMKVARIYEKITNQRNDFLHKISKHMIDDPQINTYCVEDLNIQGMVRNHRLAQSIQDVSWNTFITYLTYKAEWVGKNILTIGRFEPSSKMCNVCGKINHELTLKDRSWKCVCGKTHDQDFLAANNIRDFAFDKQNMIGTDKPESNTLREIGGCTDR